MAVAVETRKISLFGPSLGAATVALSMLAAAAVNFYQFAEIDAHTPPHVRAIHEFESFDILELGLNQSNIRDTLNLYAVVGREAPGTPLVVTSPEFNRRGSAFRARMIGIGLASRIELCEADSLGIEFAPSIKLQQGVVWEWPGQARRKAPGINWAFAKSSATPSRLVQLKTAEFDALIVDEELIVGGSKFCR